MATESVKIKIDAENKASAELRKVAFDADKAAKEIKEVGGKAKASTELVGSLANSLGGTQFGGAAGEVAMLTERISAFSDVAKQGGAGALAFKAGLVAAAGVISFKVGKAIGDVIFQTEKWNEKLAEAVKTAQALDSVSLGKFVGRISGNLESVNLELRNTTERLQSLRQEAKRLEESGGDFAVYDFDLQGRIKSKLEEVDATKKQVEALNAERTAILSLPEVNLATEKNNKVLADLKLDLEKASAEDFIERTRIELRERGVLNRSMELAMSLAVKKKRIEDAAAKADQAAKEAAIANEKKLAEAQKQRIKQQKDGLKSQIEGDKEMVKRLQAQAAALKQRDRSSLAGPLQAGSDQRGITGKAGAEFRKTAAVIEAERQTKLQSQLKANGIQQLEVLKNIERKQQQLEVIGD